MTRKQALQMAKEALAEKQEYDATAKLDEIIADMPLNHWSESAIHDAVQQFIVDHGHEPYPSDFNSHLLPSAPALRNRFGMTVREFIQKYYPHPLPEVNARQRRLSRDDAIAEFVSEYRRIAPTTAKEYDRMRGEDKLSWSTVAHMHNTRSWKLLLEITGLNATKASFTIKHKGGYYEHCRIADELTTELIQLQADWDRRKNRLTK